MAVSNHLSYLDIVVLGEQISYVFVAKSEVSQWPWIGWVARALGTIFIRRTLRGIHEGQKRIAGALSEDKAILVFAEGTTGNGILTEPFYSAFFEFEDETRIQPISICYTKVNGLPALSWVRRQLGWIGNGGMLAHLFENLSWRSLEISLMFHEPFSVGGSRKCAALTAAQYVRCGISESFKEENRYVKKGEQNG